MFHRKNISKCQSPGQISSVSFPGWRQSVSGDPGLQWDHPAPVGDVFLSSPSFQSQLFSPPGAVSSTPSLSEVSSWFPPGCLLFQHHLPVFSCSLTALKHKKKNQKQKHNNWITTCFLREQKSPTWAWRVRICFSRFLRASSSSSCCSWRVFLSSSSWRRRLLRLSFWRVSSWRSSWMTECPCSLFHRVDRVCCFRDAVFHLLVL